MFCDNINPMNDEEISWEETAKAKYMQMIEKVPPFLRGMAEKAVFEKAQALIKAQGRQQIEEKDLIDAFFEATPFGFHGPMKSDMDDVGLDYKKYGHPE